MVRAARLDDLDAVCALLANANLTAAGVSRNLDTFCVYARNGSVVGAGGLELRGSSALLRSLAVAPEHQRRGLAAAMCEYLEAEAVRRGLEDIYLLTETAERFFARRGYIAVARADAPPEIASCEQFSVLCPASAIFMRRAAR